MSRQATSAVDHREFDFSESEFERLRSLVYRFTGIALADSKQSLVYSRLSPRLRALGLSSFTDYCRLVESDKSSELEELTNAITTNLTSFFREPHHFSILAQDALPHVLATRAASRRVRLWSAGCSTGEEPYCISIVLRENLAQYSNWDVRLLATDIDSQVLSTAQNGVYSRDKQRGLSEERRTRWFDENPEGTHSGAADSLKELITFKQLNLLGSWPMQGPFDIIFCRNVVIYFDKPTQRRLFDRMADLQEPGAWLFIGHSENLNNVTDRYKLVSRTVYRRI